MDEAIKPEENDRRFLLGFGGGEVPGAAGYAGVNRDTPICIHVFDWTDTAIEERADATVEQAVAVRGPTTTSWIDVSGIHDTDLIRALGEGFELHALSIEDILNPQHRPKVEHYPDYVYLVLQMAYAREDGQMQLEQISLVLGPDYVLTFQEQSGDVFDGVRSRLRDAKSRLRSRGLDYLAYALMDAVVDDYVTIIDRVGDRIEAAEGVLDNDDAERGRGLPALLHDEKRELMALRKAVLPLRDAIAALIRDPGERIQEGNQPYLRDLHDHLVQLVDSIDIYREMVSGLLSLHLSLVGQRTNEQMRVLTVIGTVFIPLTFIVGLYGMNFKYMPELQLPWAYPALLVAMALIAGALLLYFRRRRLI